VIRPELAARLRPWAETGAALAATAFGLWVFSLGGWILWPLGAVIAVAAALWALDARRRMRFAHEALGPGMVELDEGAIRYLSPNRLLGGEISLRELAEIRLMRLNGRRHWRLKSTRWAGAADPRRCGGCRISGQRLCRPARHRHGPRLGGAGP
jgi:hypothetical protein